MVNRRARVARISCPRNRDAGDSTRCGRGAAQDVEQQLPTRRNDDVTSCGAALGTRLVRSIPAARRHPEFQSSFQVVTVRQFNAFALPHGPIDLTCGMHAAAHSQGAVAGVMAHALSHLALRHGTARATTHEIGTLIGAVVGSTIGGTVGSAVAQGTLFGLGAGSCGSAGASSARRTCSDRASGSGSCRRRQYVFGRFDVEARGVDR